ncbi:MAG: aminoacyl-tRNA hydrolase [Candidatus Binatia bacterium]
MKLLIGLGNPGRKYEQTRHNLGFLILDRVAAENGVKVKRKLCDALIGEWAVGGERVFLVKPQTYMNRSGESVNALIREFGVSSDDLVVVYDDLDLPFGKIRIRPKGSSAGHRGIYSIVESLAGAPFYRVRVGIGRPPGGIEAADFVLERFTTDEAQRLDAIIALATEAAVCLLREGGRRAMEQFNRVERKSDSVVNP